MSTLSKNDKSRKKNYGNDSSWKKVLFIFNPVSGRSQIRTDLVDILEILSRKDYVVTCYPTRCRGDARNLVRGMMEHPDKPFVPIGYIPAGTTNDFAASLGIPSDMKAAARVVAYGKPYECDLGLFNKETYFTYVAAFGIFTETSYQTPQDLKNQLGHLAYVLQGMMDLGKARTYRFHVESDEFSVTDNFVFGMITNSKSVGGFPDITGSEVDMNDGLFEVTLIKMPANILELNDILQYVSHLTDTSDMVYRILYLSRTSRSTGPETGSTEASLKEWRSTIFTGQ